MAVVAAELAIVVAAVPIKAASMGIGWESDEKNEREAYGEPYANSKAVLIAPSGRLSGGGIAVEGHQSRGH
jgi:hypothetical protein